MNFLRTFLLAPLVISSAALAQLASTPPEPVVPESAAAKKAEKSQWVFSILPKSFQKNPLVDLTVITEKSEAGKKLPPVSPAAPAYYQLESSGYHQLGHAPGNEKTLKQEDVERLLKRSLATNGYLPSTPEHPPSLLVFYTWGSHSLLIEGDDENPVYSADQIARNLLDRAALVGGVKFSQDMLQLFQEADDMATLNQVPPPDPSGAVPAIQPILGDAQMEFLNPVNRYRNSDPKHDFLVEQFTNDVYYVVASAYDYATIGARRKQLFWRTRMTVAAQGVSQEQTLPTLIVSAAPFFGKEMTEPEILTKKAVPEGTVEIGTAVVVPEPDAPKKPAEPAKKP